jgi:L-ribulose-5-phosphate 4-epimerase
MSDEMIKGNYEYETGWQIINCFKEKGLNYEEVEMMLVGNHAPFTWGKTPAKAVYNSASARRHRADGLSHRTDQARCMRG